MFRRYLLLFLLAASGCIMNHTGRRQINVCLMHGGKMRRAVVRVEVGGFTGRGCSDDAWSVYYPNARRRVCTGCIDTGKKWAVIYVCAICNQLKAEKAAAVR